MASGRVGGREHMAWLRRVPWRQSLLPKLSDRRGYTTAARDGVRAAVKAGWMVKPDACRICGGPPMHGLPFDAHHSRGYDGDNRHMVEWLCHCCHETVHGKSCNLCRKEMGLPIELEWHPVGQQEIGL